MARKDSPTNATRNKSLEPDYDKSSKKTKKIPQAKTYLSTPAKAVVSTPKGKYLNDQDIKSTAFNNLMNLTYNANHYGITKKGHQSITQKMVSNLRSPKPKTNEGIFESLEKLETSYYGKKISALFDEHIMRNITELQRQHLEQLRQGLLKMAEIFEYQKQVDVRFEPYVNMTMQYDEKINKNIKLAFDTLETTKKKWCCYLKYELLSKTRNEVDNRKMVVILHFAEIMNMIDSRIAKKMEFWYNLFGVLVTIFEQLIAFNGVNIVLDNYFDYINQLLTGAEASTKEKKEIYELGAPNAELCITFEEQIMENVQIPYDQSSDDEKRFKTPAKRIQKKMVDETSESEFIEEDTTDSESDSNSYLKESVKKMSREITRLKSEARKNKLLIPPPHQINSSTASLPDRINRLDLGSGREKLNEIDFEPNSPTTTEPYSSPSDTPSCCDTSSEGSTP